MSFVNHSGCIDSALDSLCKPDLIRLEPNLFAAKFDLMKIIPARYILEKALKNGELRPGGLVVESSSGTFALGLAIVCAAHGLKLSLITGPLEGPVRWRLEHLGAKIESLPSAGSTLGGIQQSRLNRLQQLIKDTPGAFWPRQYTNPLHPDAYWPVGTAISQAIGKVDILIATVGTGSSMGGIARALRPSNSELSVVGVDHNLSVLFGPTSGEAYPLCHYGYLNLLGSGSDIVIPNLDHTQCNEVHWLPIAPTIRAVHHLHKRHGLFVGPTSGGTYAIAQRVTKQYPDKTILAIFPDDGVRYLDTVFNSQWLKTNASELERHWPEPVLVSSPSDVGKDWAYMQWNCRSYVDVMGHAPVSRE